MIIDFGSFEILVSYEMVNKLKLQKFPMERPYKASWVSDEKNIVVREKEVFDFSIGSYPDSSLCDVIPMTCCHIILERPWQASRDTIHHGLENMYIMHKDGLKFCLNPLPSNDGDGGRIVCVGEKKYITLEDQTKSGADLKHKASLVTMKSHVADHKSSDLQQMVYENRIYIYGHSRISS